MSQHMLKWFMTNFEKPKLGEVARIIIMVVMVPVTVSRRMVMVAVVVMRM